MSFKNTWLAFRNRCLTSPRFHDLALKFPLTRPVVRKRQSEVFDVVAGFVYSQVLAACVELGLLRFAPLKETGASLEEISSFCDLKEDETRRLIDAASSLRILQKSADRYFLGELGAPLSINDGALRMIAHHHHLYKDMTDPVDLLRAGRRETNLSRYWDYARSSDPAASKAQNVSEYSELMSASQADVAKEVIASFDFSSFKRMLDVGGGEGTFCGHVQAACPDLEIGVFDLPEVAARGREKQSGGGMSEGIEFHAGSFFHDKLPCGYDLISLIRIVHDHDDEPVLKLFAAIYEALPDRGTLVIAEPMSTGGNAGRISDAYFNFYLYAMGSGRPRTPDHIRQMLKNAGFSRSRLKMTRSGFVASLIVAHK